MKSWSQWRTNSAVNPIDIQPAGENCWLIHGNVSLEDINYELDLELEAVGADRLAG